MPFPIILNPAARSARAGSLEQTIRALQPAPIVHLTEGSGDAERLAFELAGQGWQGIVAAGGDGTVNEVVTGLARHNAAVADPAKHVSLGVLPVGTMNVFAYELGIPGRNLPAAWEQINSGARREIDLWQANEYYFAQLAGVGLDAEIVEATSWEMKRRYGPLSYALSAMTVLAREAPTLSVHIDGRPPLYGCIVLIGSGRHYGGPVPVFRNARNDDGLLDIVILRKVRPLEVFQFLVSIVDGDYQDREDIVYLQASSFRVESDKRAPFEVDGELGGSSPVTFRPAPFKLKLLG